MRKLKNDKNKPSPFIDLSRRTSLMDFKNKLCLKKTLLVKLTQAALG